MGTKQVKMGLQKIWSGRSPECTFLQARYNDRRERKRKGLSKQRFREGVTLMWIRSTCSHIEVYHIRTLDNRCGGLMRKVKIWAFWTGQNHKIFLKFVQIKSGQHPRPKFSSGLCIKPQNLKNWLDQPIRPQKCPRSPDDTLKAY